MPFAVMQPSLETGMDYSLVYNWRATPILTRRVLDRRPRRVGIFRITFVASLDEPFRVKLSNAGMGGELIEMLWLELSSANSSFNVTTPYNQVKLRDNSIQISLIFELIEFWRVIGSPSMVRAACSRSATMHLVCYQKMALLCERRPWARVKQARMSALFQQTEVLHCTSPKPHLKLGPKVTHSKFR